MKKSAKLRILRLTGYAGCLTAAILLPPEVVKVFTCVIIGAVILVEAELAILNWLDDNE